MNPAWTAAEIIDTSLSEAKKNGCRRFRLFLLFVLIPDKWRGFVQFFKVDC